MDLDRAEFDRVFPSGKDLDPHFPQLESWIQANYHAASTRHCDVFCGGRFG